MQIVNYAGIDVKGVAPSISISTNASDVDAGTPGIQVVEGTVLQIHPTAATMCNCATSNCW